MHRREFLQTSVIGSAVFLSGCSSSTEGNDEKSQESRFEHTPGECKLESDGGESHGCSDELNIHTVNGEQRGDNLYVFGTVENISGKPLEYVTMEAEFYDETKALIETSRKRLKTFFHGDVWEFELKFDGTLNEKRAVASFNVDASVGDYLDPVVALTDPENCGDTQDWWCDGNAKLSSLNEDFVTRESGKEEWMVWGDIENIGEETIWSIKMSAHYRDGNTIYEGHLDRFFSEVTGLDLAPGNTDTFRLSFGEQRPLKGDVSVYMWEVRLD
jgi:hypothetical protein